MVLIIETQVIQILTGKPELLSSLKYLMFIIIGYPLTIFVDSIAKAPHKSITACMGILTIIMTVTETICNNVFRISYHDMMVFSSIIVIINYIFTLYLMFNDVKYYRSKRLRAPTFNLYFAVVVIISCTIIDLVYSLVMKGHVTDHSVLSRISYVIFIIILLVRLVRVSIKRDQKAMLAEKYRNEAITDAMTGLYNKQAYMEKENELSIKLSQALNGHDMNFKFIVMTLDLNNLKTVNDTLGHEK